MIILKRHKGMKYDKLNIILKPLVCALFSYAFTKMMLDSVFGDMGALLNFVVLSVIFVVIFTILLILSKTIAFSEIKFLKYCK